jgi:hypothetical protein
MQNMRAVGSLPTAPACSSTLLGIDRAALERSKDLLRQTSLANANADGVTDEERQHHLDVARQVTIESAVFTSSGRRYSYSTVGKRA